MRVTFCSSPLLFILFAIAFEESLLAGGSLDNDIVKNWSAHVEGYLLKLAEEGLKTRELQKLYDSANYTVEEKSGFDTINSVKSRLGNYFVKKENTARVGCIFFWLLQHVNVNLKRALSIFYFWIPRVYKVDFHVTKRKLTNKMIVTLSFILTTDAFKGFCYFLSDMLLFFPSFVCWIFPYFLKLNYLPRRKLKFINCCKLSRQVTWDFWGDVKQRNIN